MKNLENLLCVIYDDLQAKMYKCKTIHLRYKLIDDHKEFLMKQSVLTVYSSWEGFLKKSLSLYLQELNNRKLTYNNLNENYLAYQTDLLCAFKTQKTDYEVIKKISKQIYNMYLKNEVVFNTKIDTQSNANLKITNSILNKLNLNYIDNKYDNDLNKLIFFRNSVAHGDERGIVINQKDIDRFTLLVQNLSADLIDSILIGLDKNVYLYSDAGSP